MTLECGSQAAAFRAGEPKRINPVRQFQLILRLWTLAFVIPSEARNLLFHVAPR